MQRGRQVAVRQRAGIMRNAAPYAAAVARGVATAMRNRKAIEEAVGAVKRRLNQRPRPKKKARTATVRSDPASTGNEFTQYKSKVGRYPKLRPQRLLKLMQAGMTDITFRFQGLTNFDTNVGYFAIANRNRADINPIAIPIHVYDLTSLPNITNTVSPGGYFAWSGSTSAATASRYVLPCQNADGSLNPAGYWQIEKSSGARSGTTTVPLHASKACHEWCSISMNLYGARKRGTQFYIDIVRCKDDFSNLVSANETNKEYNDLMRTLQSNLVYSNLQQHNMRNLRQLQFVKRYKFYIPGGSQDDLDTIGKIKEFKLFLKQGNVYNLEWQSAETEEQLPHAQEDGLDFASNEGPQNYPRHKSRLFMIIRAFSPERRTIANGASYATEPADPLTEPSYDIVIRNKWLLPH